MEFATPFQRLMAFLVDFALFIIIVVALCFAFPNPSAEEGVRLIFDDIAHLRLTYSNLLSYLSMISNPKALLTFFLISVVYFILFIILPVLTNGRTIGKFIAHIRIVRLNEDKLTFGTMFLREILSILIANFFTLGIISIISIVQLIYARGNRTIPDRMANTLIVKETVVWRRFY